MWDPAATPYQSSFILLTFLGLLFLFHFVFIIILKLTDRAWKLVDYAWLAFAAFALPGAAYQAQEYVTSVAMNNAAIAVNQTIQRTSDSINMLESSLCKIASESAAEAIPGAEYRSRDADRLCKWLNKIRFAIAVSYNSENAIRIDASFEDYPEAVDFLIKTNWESHIRSTLERDFMSYNIVLPNLVDWKERLNKLQLSSVRNLFVPLLPLILAIAISLRITKVTGELRNRHRASTTSSIPRLEFDDEIARINEAINSRKNQILECDAKIARINEDIDSRKNETVRHGNEIALLQKQNVELCERLSTLGEELQKRVASMANQLHSGDGASQG